MFSKGEASPGGDDDPTTEELDVDDDPPKNENNADEGWCHPLAIVCRSVWRCFAHPAAGRFSCRWSRFSSFFFSFSSPVDFRWSRFSSFFFSFFDQRGTGGRGPPVPPLQLGRQGGPVPILPIVRHDEFIDIAGLQILGLQDLVDVATCGGGVPFFFYYQLHFFGCSGPWGSSRREDIAQPWSTERG